MLVRVGGDAARVVVTDFGLARPMASADGTSSLGAGAGTPGYMAPEQLKGGPITPAVDIFAFGVVLYEMVTGRLPFQGHTPLAMAVKRLSERPVPPSAHNASLDPRWEKAILRCLERDPTARFADALDVVRALDAGPPARRRGLWLAGPAVIAGVAAAAIGVHRLGRSDPGSITRSRRGVESERTHAAAAVALDLVADPPTASWFLDGAPLDCNPCRIVRDLGSVHHAMARSPGFSDQERQLLFDHARQERMVLAPVPGKPAPSRPRPHPRSASSVDIAPRSPQLDKSNPYE